MQPGPFTMTGEELKDVHNGLCYMRFAIEKLEGVVHPNLVKELKTNFELIEKGMKGVREQEEAADKIACDLVERVSEQLKLKHAIISLGNVTNFDAVPFPKANKLVYDRHEVAIPERATWKDLLKAADYLIEKSQDFHHVFVESIYEGGIRENVSDAYLGQVLFMSCGS